MRVGRGLGSVLGGVLVLFLMILVLFPPGAANPASASDLAQQSGPPFVISFPMVQLTRDDLMFAESNLPVMQVSAGYAHACALRPNGEVVCWGLDGAGQATPLPGVYRQVDAGANHTCALRQDGGAVEGGTAACWGENLYGQSTPPEGVFTQISAGGYHTCALDAAGAVSCWGWNAFQQLENIPAGSFTQISAGNFHTCALRDDGAVVCWGWNANNETAAPQGSFINVSAGGSHSCAVGTGGSLTCWGSNSSGESSVPAGSYRAVSAGDFHTCAMREDTTLACWGGNGFGQLNEIPQGTFRQISAGGQHTCALRTGGTLACWGWNRYGQSFPPSGVELSAGGSHACAVRVDGSLSCWGENGSGQAAAPDGAFTDVSAGSQHTCAVNTDGVLVCWGADGLGQLAAPQGTFFEVSAGDGYTCAMDLNGAIHCWGGGAGAAESPAGLFTHVSAGDAHACALNGDGAVLCWGENGSGQAAAPTGTFTQVSAGGAHTCALANSGALNCWGENGSGQTAAPAGTFSQVSAGRQHSCGLRADGTLACWGDDSYGQSSAPAGIFSRVSAGGTFSCAVRLDGSVTCWGDESAAPRVTVLPETLPDGFTGEAYVQALSASGGAPPYTFTVSTGSLPPGLALTADGALSGVPTTEGGYTFTIQAADSSSPAFSAGRVYAINVTSFRPDLTPPVIQPIISGPKGLGDWYTGTVVVQWQVSDPDSPISGTSGCQTVRMTEDTPGETITCSASSAGGTASKSVTIRIDGTPPSAVTGEPERAPDQNGWYNHPVTVRFRGSDATAGLAECTTVTYDGPDSAKAAVEGTCADAAGNTASGIFRLAYDATAPTLQPVAVPKPVLLYGSVEIQPNAADATSGLAEVRCETPDTSRVGIREVRCTATDVAGNTATASALYAVVYKFVGFLPPVENLPAFNVVTAGQNVPIRWRLYDAFDRPVSGVTDIYMDVIEVPCPAARSSAAPLAEQAVQPESRTNPYHFNWKTSSAYAGTCQKFVLDLSEGQKFQHFALFEFRP